MKKLLIIEDDLDLRTNLKELLEAEGFEVKTANDGLEGYEIILKNQFDLIICDIYMPRMDGKELLKKLQEEKAIPSTSFVFLTARADMSELREGMTSGADDYLVKPFKADELLKSINMRLQKREESAKQVSNLRETMIRKIPHELRTPLVGILGFSEVIENDIENLNKLEIRKMAQCIRKSGVRLHRRIEKFLTFADLSSQVKDKSENSKNQFEVDEELITALLNDIVMEFDRNEDIIFDIEKAQLMISPEQHILILRELLENALKFSNKGSGIIIMGRKNGTCYKTRIINSGKGIPAKYLKEIGPFNMFSENKDTEEGAGLGLAIVNKLIDLVDGYIKVESKENSITKIEFGISLINLIE